METVTDSLNNRQEYTYNARGRQMQVIDADGHATGAAYDLLGNITRLFGPLGGCTEYTYDTLGRLIAETTTSGGKVTYVYNALHLREEIVNARGQSRIIGLLSEEITSGIKRICFTRAVRRGCFFLYFRKL
ncbi:MAG: RHS repeat protein [Clostridia bacterium]|nr:RHS repeat protein [Clostridia bacterium]